MCWSGEASAVLAVVGIGTTAYAAYKKEPAPLWMALGYFSSMELLQAFTYSVIDQCALPSNQIATLLGYLHIVFQPFFINMLSHVFHTEFCSRENSMAGLCRLFWLGSHHASAALPFRMGRVMSTGARTMWRSALLSLRRLAYRLGDTDKRHAELHNRRFVGIFPKPVSHLLHCRNFAALRLWLLAVHRLSFPRRAAIGQAPDQQPQ